MIRLLFAAFFLLISATAWASGFTNSISHCKSRTITPENLEAVESPEAQAINTSTGIQIVTIKKPVEYKGLRYKLNLSPIADAEKKSVIAHRVALFLKMLPQDFLRKNSDTCFILTDEIQQFQGITTGHIILIPSDSALDAISHEFMHAVDDIHESDLSFEGWEQINETSGCKYDQNVNVNVPFPVNSIDANCFVSPYAKSDPYEDHAEVFSALIQKLQKTLPIQGKKNSSIVDKAVDVKQYLQTIDESMNEDFWNAFDHDGQP